jgi:LacI family transcriptional regulator
MSEKKHITIHDLAKLAGVSVATISRSLNNSPLVQAETKQKILKLADDMGFEINASAKGLATSKVDTIGIILPPEYDKFGQQLYYASLMDDLRESLERSHYDLIVSFATNRFTRKSNILRLINRKKVDGLIILRETLEQDILNFLEKKNVPYVFSHYPPNAEDFAFDAVYPDHFWGGKLAGEYLVSLGCQRILCLSVENRANEFVLREKGFYQALSSHNIQLAEADRLYSPLTLEGGYRVVKEHAEKLSNTEALFAVTDLLAFGAIQAIEEIGLHIPKDISVIGYDDIPLAAALQPTLTTIHQPREEIAQKTCQRLIEKIRGGKSAATKLREAIRPYLVVRESCQVRHKAAK